MLVCDRIFVKTLFNDESHYSRSQPFLFKRILEHPHDLDQNVLMHDMLSLSG